jgi:hypothetical protein
MLLLPLVSGGGLWRWDSSGAGGNSAHSHPPATPPRISRVFESAPRIYTRVLFTHLHNTPRPLFGIC